VHTNYKWPETNPVELKVQFDTGSDDYLQINNYRYPSQYDKDHAEYRGAIFFVHGFADHAGPYAHHGEIYSKLGYDFYAMDVRGHGKSEG
jgi:alpha-beta hydrolase superfamily lysophospholipase